MMRLNLRQKINGAILITFLAISFIFISIQLPLQKDRYEINIKRIETTLHALVERDREYIANEIFQHLDRALVIRLDQMLELESILSISVFDRTGELLVSRGPAPETLALTETEIITFENVPRSSFQEWRGVFSMAYFREIQIVGETIGFIRVHYSLENLRNKIRHTWIIFGSLLGSILAVMLILLNLIMSRTIVRPILSLGETMQKMQAGEIEQHVYHKSNDEIGHLSKIFNNMSKDLAASYREIELKGAQVAESQEKYRLVVEHCNDAIVVIQDGFIKYINPRAESLSGYTATEQANMSFGHMLMEDDRDLVLGNYRARIDGRNAPDNYTFRIRNKSGEVVWLNASIVTVTWDDHPATLNFFRDITDQKKTEEKLLHAQKMKAVGTLAGGIAHDFNNLLQIIQGYVQLLLYDHKENMAFRRELEAIFRAAVKGGELATQLLTFGRKVESRLEPINLNLLIHNSQQMLSRTIPKMIDMELHPGGRVSTIYADSGQIEQVLINLVINARDAMPDGGKIIIETENILLDENLSKAYLLPVPGEYVLLSISDTGVGMEKEMLDHIFDPFYTTKEIGQGTGLGLAMVYGIIRNHKGSIQCDSIPGEGTTFRIYLPIETEPEAPSSVHTPSAPRGGNETVLIVDDDEVIRDIGSRILERFGYRVLTAVDGETALDVYTGKQAGIDLVILDLMMPGMGGTKCLDGLLKLNPEVYVIVASGFSDEGSVKSSLDAGARGFIKKPFVMENMLHEIRRVLDSE